MTLAAVGSLRERPVRVLQLGSPSGLFGAERWILALIKHLSRDCVETVVGAIQDGAAGSPEPPLCVQARAMGFDTLTIDAPGRVSRAAVEGLRHVVLERGIDVVHTHFYKSTIVGALATRGTGCRLVATPHGWSTSAGIKLEAYQLAEKVAFGWADAVAPLSKDLEAGLSRLPWVRQRLCLIENGVDLSEVTASMRVAPEIAGLRKDGTFVVGYIGQLIARKRVDTLLEAFAALRRDRKRLFIVGDGDQRTALSQKATDLGIAHLVTFTGFRDDRLDFLRGFDALVLPSVLEGIPRCLMEGMAAGVPVIGTDIPGTRDLVEHGRTGWLFPVGDSAALAAALDGILKDRAATSAIVAGARESVSTRFSAAVMSARYQTLFKNVTAGTFTGRNTRPGERGGG